MSGAQAVLTVGILGLAGYAVVKSRETQTLGAGATPASFTVTTRPKKKGFRGVLLGALGGILSENTGDKSGILGGIFGKGEEAETEETVANAPAPFGQTKIGSQLMYNLQKHFGFKKFQAAGIVGNLHLESAGFTKLQETQPMQWQGGKLVPSKTNRGGYGYAQWTGPRRRQFEAFAKKHNLALSSFTANYGFLRHEMKNTAERRVVNRLLATKTVEEATIVFMKTYLRPGIPHADSRISFARRYA